jgi:RNA polymerase primary sigma factor
MRWVNLRKPVAATARKKTPPHPATGLLEQPGKIKKSDISRIWELHRYRQKCGKTEDLAKRKKGLTREEEAFLFQKHEIAAKAIADLAKKLGEANGDRKAIEKELERMRAAKRLITSAVAGANQGLVGSVAIRMISSKHIGHLLLEDLIQEGNVGFIEKGMAKFDYRRGYRVSTYVTWWISHSITRAYENQDRTIRLTSQQLGDARKVFAFRGVFYTKNGREPTEAEISKKTGVPLARVRRALQPPEVVDIHKENENGEVLDPLENIAGVSADPIELISDADNCARVRPLLSQLEPREQEIVKRKYGIGTGDGETLQSIGKDLGLSRERIRQILEKALEKLRGILGRMETAEETG